MTDFEHNFWPAPDEEGASEFMAGFFAGVVVLLVVEVVFALAAWGIWTWVH